MGSDDMLGIFEDICFSRCIRLMCIAMRNVLVHLEKFHGSGHMYFLL